MKERDSVALKLHFTLAYLACFNETFVCKIEEMKKQEGNVAKKRYYFYTH